MEWARRLSPRIFLNDGRQLSTLDDVKTLLGSLPASRRRDLPWQFAEALLLDAAGNGVSTEELSAHLNRVLKAEGMIGDPG
jgi:hypothetical protein